MVETVIFDYVRPNCDFDLEDSKPVFLHDTLAHEDASPYQVWLQKGFRMSPRRGLDLEDCKLFFFLHFLHATLSGSQCCITVLSLVPKYSAVQKMSSGKHSLTS